MSPFVRKVLVFCAEKGIALELQSVGIGSRDEG
jgi:glutathione S-transferase